ncbi:MAG: inositol monophosphatase family protein [Actinomycetota bacterium]
MFEKELAFANEMADRAGEIAMSVFGGDFEVKAKADQTPVTEADLRIEAMVREALARAFPSDAILGEEEGKTGSADRVWVIDPIDGTKNFADGIQIWATLIGLAVEGVPVAGVVAAPALGERYEAAHGSGARLNGDSIRVSKTESMPEALVAYGGLEAWLGGPREDAFKGMVEDARRTRGLGDFWGHMLVARGAADAMIEPELRTWDTVAVQAIVEESGGRMTTFVGEQLSDRSSVLSTNGRLHDELMKRLAG